MKLLKNMMVMFVLFGLHSLEAKRVGEAAASKSAPAALMPAPAKGGAVVVAAKSNVTYKQLHDNIIKMPNSNKNLVIDAKTGMLNGTFIKNTENEAQKAGLDSLLFGGLLQTGVAKFATFPNKEEDAVALVNKINAQISKAVEDFEE